MKANANESYVNEGSDVTEIPDQSPGTLKSFPSNMQICEPNNTGVTSPTHISSHGITFGSPPDEVYESTMVTWHHTRKMRQMTVFLVFFVVIALVMTGLFVWRTVFFDNLGSDINDCNDKICTTVCRYLNMCTKKIRTFARIF